MIFIGWRPPRRFGMIVRPIPDKGKPMTITIHGSPVSPFVRKTRVLLTEKDVDYALDKVNPFDPPDGFRELSPLGRIPAMTDSEKGSLADSSVICAYLEKRFPEPPLYPEDPYEHGRALWFEEYMDTEFAALSGRGIFQPIVVFPLMRDVEPDIAKAKETLHEKLPACFDYLERELDGREFFVGDRLTIADIAVASPFVNMWHAGASVDAGRWPALAAFVERMHGTGSFSRCIADEDFFHRPVDLSP